MRAARCIRSVTHVQMKEKHHSLCFVFFVPESNEKSLADRISLLLLWWYRRRQSQTVQHVCLCGSPSAVMHDKQIQLAHHATRTLRLVCSSAAESVLPPRAMISHAETDSVHSLPLGGVIVYVPRISIWFYFLRGGWNIRGVLHPTPHRIRLTKKLPMS